MSLPKLGILPWLPCILGLCSLCMADVHHYDFFGVWFMHCHFERHSSWGMDTVFIAKNGATAETSIRRPPAGMPVSSGA
ncbi:hypothetical protein V6N12_054753 [Hibiscus sabdariffa]|uniref:Plastocyanin-like domain-containing protein n=1 Tax=Hibiscus sabdariffa TaxID=183260 RepID=A0ABR2D256_9ROSI